MRTPPQEYGVASSFSTRGKEWSQAGSWSLERFGPLTRREKWGPENKAAESVDHSRRRQSPRFAASVPWRSRLLRQRRGVPDLHCAGGAGVGQAFAVEARCRGFPLTIFLVSSTIRLPWPGLSKSK